MALLPSHCSKATLLQPRPTRPRDLAQAALAGVAVVVALAALTRFLEQTVPAAAKGTAFAGIAAAIEFPVYAILLGLLGNLALTRLGLRDRLAGGFRTEFFIKTGLVLLGRRSTSRSS